MIVCGTNITKYLKIMISMKLYDNMLYCLIDRKMFNKPHQRLFCLPLPSQHTIILKIVNIIKKIINIYKSHSIE